MSDGKTRKWRVACAWLVLALLVSAVPALAGDDRPVMPVIHWSAEQQAVIVTMPPEVLAWMRGEVDDPDGALASWKERYDRQSVTPGFAWAVLELQGEVRRAVESGATAFEVEHEVIPRILEQRGDIREGLYGRSLEPQDKRCWMEITGSWECSWRLPYLDVCVSWNCVESSGMECSFWRRIDCPQDELEVEIGIENR